MTLPTHTTTVVTRGELRALWAARWDYVPRSERMAIYRDRMARARAERQARQ